MNNILAKVLSSVLLFSNTVVLAKEDTMEHVHEAVINKNGEQKTTCHVKERENVMFENTKKIAHDAAQEVRKAGHVVKKSAIQAAHAVDDAAHRGVEKTKEAASYINDKTVDGAHHLKDKALEVAHKAQEATHHGVDKVKEVASDVGDKASHVAHDAKDKASSVLAKVGEFAHDVKDSTTHALDKAGESIKNAYNKITHTLKVERNIKYSTIGQLDRAHEDVASAYFNIDTVNFMQQEDIKKIAYNALDKALDRVVSSRHTIVDFNDVNDLYTHESLIKVLNKVEEQILNASKEISSQENKEKNKEVALDRLNKVLKEIKSARHEFDQAHELQTIDQK